MKEITRRYLGYLTGGPFDGATLDLEHEPHYTTVTLERLFLDGAELVRQRCTYAAAGYYIMRPKAKVGLHQATPEQIAECLVGENKDVLPIKVIWVPVGANEQE